VKPLKLLTGSEASPSALILDLTEKICGPLLILSGGPMRTIIHDYGPWVALMRSISKYCSFIETGKENHNLVSEKLLVGKSVLERGEQFLAWLKGGGAVPAENNKGLVPNALHNATFCRVYVVLEEQYKYLQFRLSDPARVRNRPELYGGAIQQKWESVLKAITSSPCLSNR